MSADYTWGSVRGQDRLVGIGIEHCQGHVFHCQILYSHSNINVGSRWSVQNILDSGFVVRVFEREAVGNTNRPLQVRTTGLRSIRGEKRWEDNTSCRELHSIAGEERSSAFFSSGPEVFTIWVGFREWGRQIYGPKVTHDLDVNSGRISSVFEPNREGHVWATMVDDYRTNKVSRSREPWPVYRLKLFSHNFGLLLGGSGLFLNLTKGTSSYNDVRDQSNEATDFKAKLKPSPFAAWVPIFGGLVIFIYCYWQCKFGDQNIDWPGILQIAGVFVGFVLLGYGFKMFLDRL